MTMLKFITIIFSQCQENWANGRAGQLVQMIQGVEEHDSALGPVQGQLLSQELVKELWEKKNSAVAVQVVALLWRCGGIGRLIVKNSLELYQALLV